MTTRESLVAAVADRPGEDTTRLVLADWLEEHGESGRADFIRASCAAARTRPGNPHRAGLLDRAGDLLARHEADWLGEWRDRLIDWDFRRGFLHRVRLTAGTFLRHGEELFRAEPVARVELVSDEGEPLDEDAVRAAIRHPAFGLVRDCAVVTPRFSGSTPLHVWLGELASGPRVTRLRRFAPVTHRDFGEGFGSGGEPFGEPLFARFCQAEHLKTLRSLDLSCDYLQGQNERPWLISRLASASFARGLRTLIMENVGLRPEELHQLAGSRAFGALKTLNVTGNADAPDAWSALFGSATLKAVTSIRIAAIHLPAYARSPMAGRVRDLTVLCADDLDRSLAADRAAWLQLIEHAPPPRRLTLVCHNPGRRVFAAMRRKRWLREVRALSIRGDSQYEVYSGRTAGIRSLFGPGAMRRLASLKLHEACDASTLATLAEWPGLGRLEELELTDDYHGRLNPDRLGRQASPNGLRTLRGAVLTTDEDVSLFLEQYPLERLARLHLSFCAGYDQATRGFVPRLSPASAGKLMRSERWAHLTDLTLGFYHLPEVESRLAQVLADPSVMPRLRRVRLYASFGYGRPSLDGLRARFGLGLQD